MTSCNEFQDIIKNICDQLFDETNLQIHKMTNRQTNKKAIEITTIIFCYCQRDNMISIKFQQNQLTILIQIWSEINDITNIAFV